MLAKTKTLMIQLFKVLLQLSLIVARQVERKQIVDATEATLIREQLEYCNARLLQANKARLTARAGFDINQLRDDHDPYKRD